MYEAGSAVVTLSGRVITEGFDRYGKLVETARAQKEHSIILGAKVNAAGFDGFLKKITGVEAASKDAAVSISKSLSSIGIATGDTAKVTTRNLASVTRSLDRTGKGFVGLGTTARESAVVVRDESKSIVDSLMGTSEAAKKEAADFEESQKVIRDTLGKTGEDTKRVAGLIGDQDKRISTSIGQTTEAYKARADAAIRSNERLVASEKELAAGGAGRGGGGHYMNPIIGPGGGGGGEGGPMGRQAEQQAKRTESEWKKGANTLATLGKWTSLAAAGIGIVTVKWAADFQRQMELVHTQSGYAQQDVDRLTKKVLDLAPAVGIGPEELAKGLFHIANVGIPAAKAMDVLKIAAEGAQVGNASLENTTNALVAIWKTSPKDIHSVGEAMGVMNDIVGRGNLRMDDLNKALTSGVLIAAKGVGLGLRDLGAALDVMTSRGVPAEQAATRLRTTLTLIGTPTAKAEKALGELGFTQSRLAEDMRKHGLVYALTDLKTAMDKTFPPGGHLSIEQERQALMKYGRQLEANGVTGKTLAKDLLAYKQILSGTGSSATKQAQLITNAFGGSRMGTTMVALIQNLTDVKKHTDELNKAGAAERFHKAWEATQKDFSVQVGKMWSGIKTLGIYVGDWIIPKLKAFVMALVDAFKWLEKHKVILDALAILIGTVLTAAVAAFFARLAIKTAEGIKDIGKFGKAIGYDLPKAIAGGVKSAIESLGKLKDKITGVKDEQAALNDEAAAGGASGIAPGSLPPEATGGGGGAELGGPILGMIEGVKGPEAPGSEANPLAVVLMAGEPYGLGARGAGVAEESESQIAAKQAEQTQTSIADQPKPVGPAVASSDTQLAEEESGLAASGTAAEQDLAKSERSLMGTLGASARGFGDTVTRSAKSLETSVLNAASGFGNKLSQAWQSLTGGKGGSILPGTGTSAAEKDAAAMERAGAANAAKMQTAMSRGGNEAATAQEEGITKGGAKAAADQEAGVTKGGAKAAADQESGVTKGGAKAAADQESGVAKGGAKAASDQEAGITKGGAKAAADQEAGVAKGGVRAAGDIEGAEVAGGTKAGGEIGSAEVAGGAKAGGEIGTAEAAGGAKAAADIETAEAAGGATAAEEEAAGTAAGGAGAGAAGVAGGAAEGAGGATLFSMLKSRLGGLSVPEAAIPVAIVAGAANAFTSGTGISGQTYGTGLARALGPSSEQLGNAAFGVPSGFHTSSSIGDVFGSLTGGSQKIVANMSDDVKKLNNQLKNMHDFTGLSSTAMANLAREMEKVKGEGDTTKDQRAGITRLLALLSQAQIQKMVNAIAAIKFPTEPRFMQQISDSFKSMGPTARKQGADAMIELSRTLEQEGRLPKGSTDQLIKDIEDKYPGLKQFIIATGHGSMEALNKEFQDQKTVRTVQSQVDSIKRNWGLLPHLAKTNGNNVYDNWKAALDAVTEKMHTGPAASRAAAKKEYDRLLAMQDDVTKAMVDHWANALSSMVGVSGSQFWNMSSTAISALKAIGESTNQALRSLGLDPVRWTWAMSVSGALGQAAQQKAFAQAQSYKGRTAIGGMFPSTPGGEIIQVAEGGYPEVVLTTDPQHVDRQRNLLSQYLRMAPNAAHGVVPGYATGGVLGAVGRTVSQISGTLTAPAGTFSDVAHAALMEFTKSVNDFIKRMSAHVPAKHAIGGIVGGPQTLGGTTGGRSLNMLGVGSVSITKAATGPQGAVDSLTHSLGNMGLTAASASKYASDHMATNLEKMTKTVDDSLKKTRTTTKTNLNDITKDHKAFGAFVTKNTYDTYIGSGGTATGTSVGMEQNITNAWKTAESTTKTYTDKIEKTQQTYGQNITKVTSTSYADLSKDIAGSWQDIEKTTNTNTKKVTQTTTDAATTTRKNTSSQYDQMFQHIDSASKQDYTREHGHVNDRVSLHQQGAHDIASAQAKLATASGDILSKMDTATYDGTKTVFDNLNKALDALGASSSKVKLPGMSPVTASAEVSGVNRLVPFAGGGVLPGAEFGYGDVMTLVDPAGRPRAKMAGDEAVFNRHQMPYVNAGLQMLGFVGGASQLWNTVDRPHGYESGGWLGNSSGIRRFATGGNVWEVRTSQEASSSGSGWTELSPNGNAAAFLGIPHSFSNNPAHYPDFASLGKMYPRGFELKIRSSRGSGTWPLTDVGDGSSYAPAIGLTPAVSSVLGPGGTTVQITAADGSDIHPYPGMAKLISGTGGFAAAGPAGGIGGVGWSNLTSPKVKGVKGAPQTIAQKAVDKITGAANTYGQSHMPVATGGGAAGTWGGGVVPGIVSKPSGYVFPFPKGMSFQWNRIDQGQDLEEAPGGPVLAIAPGTVSSRSDAFSGFGPYYAVETISSGPLAGQGVYYGHTKTVKTGSVKAGDVIAVTQTSADSWTAAPAGWLEFGFESALGNGNQGQGAAMAPILHAIYAGNYAKGGYLPMAKGEPGETPLENAPWGTVPIGPTMDDLRERRTWNFAGGGYLPGYQSGGGNPWSPLPGYVTSLPGFRPVRERRGASGIYTVGGGSGGRGSSGTGTKTSSRGTTTKIKLPTTLPGKGKKGKKGATGKTTSRTHIPLSENTLKVLEDIGFGFLGTDQGKLGNLDADYTDLDDVYNAVSPSGLDIGQLDRLMAYREEEWDILARDYPDIPVAITALDDVIALLTGQKAHRIPYPKGVGKLQTGEGIVDPLHPPPKRTKLGEWVAGKGLLGLEQREAEDTAQIAADKRNITKLKREIQLDNRQLATEKHDITAQAMKVASDFASAMAQDENNLFSLTDAQSTLASQVISLESQRNNLTSAKSSQAASTMSLSQVVSSVLSGNLPGTTKAASRADDPARKAIDSQLLKIRAQMHTLTEAKTKISQQHTILSNQKNAALRSLRTQGFAAAWDEQQKKWGLQDKIYEDQTHITGLEAQVKNYKTGISSDKALLKQEQSALGNLNEWLTGGLQGNQSMREEFQGVGLELVDLYMQGADLPTPGRKEPTPSQIQNTLSTLLGVPVPPIVRPDTTDWTTLSPDEQRVFDLLQYDLAQVQGGLTPNDPTLGDPKLGAAPSATDPGFPAWEAGWEKIIYTDVLSLWQKRLAEAKAGGAPINQLTTLQDDVNQAQQDLAQLAADTGTGASPADVAAAAIADFLAFQTSRATLFSQFGSNFVAAGMSPAGSPAGIAAGAQFYGAAAGPASGGVAGSAFGNTGGAITRSGPGLARGGYVGGGSLGPGNTTITIHQNFAAGPPDPHTYSQGLAYELRARM